jgi:hypothetical protein
MLQLVNPDVAARPTVSPMSDAPDVFVFWLFTNFGVRVGDRTRPSMPNVFLA